MAFALDNTFGRSAQVVLHAALAPFPVPMTIRIRKTLGPRAATTSQRIRILGHRALLASRDCSPSHSRPKVSAARFWKERASESSAYGVAMSRAKWSVTRVRSGRAYVTTTRAPSRRTRLSWRPKSAARRRRSEERSKRTHTARAGGVRGGRPVEKRVRRARSVCSYSAQRKQTS